MGTWEVMYGTEPPPYPTPQISETLREREGGGHERRREIREFSRSTAGLSRPVLPASARPPRAAHRPWPPVSLVSGTTEYPRPQAAAFVALPDLLGPETFGLGWEVRLDQVEGFEHQAVFCEEEA